MSKKRDAEASLFVLFDIQLFVCLLTNNSHFLSDILILTIIGYNNLIEINSLRPEFRSDLGRFIDRGLQRS